jgi:hypothetical protein
MAGSYKIYRTRDFIKKSQKGKVDLHRSLALVRELAEAADFHKDSNIMIDLRDTTGKLDLRELLEVTLEFARYKNVFRNKMVVDCCGLQLRL